MNNKPVAWMSKKGILSYVNDMGFTIPLYTHPVKELDEDFDAICLENKRLQAEIEALNELNTMLKDAIEKRIEMDANRYRFIQNFAEEQHQRAVALEMRELTDEEIRHIQAQCHLKDVGYDGFIMRFARAILLKAQEK